MKILGMVFLLAQAQAATVAVVDSGTDFLHQDLRGSAWVNPGETAGDRIDNDGNGKVDDVHGWNFFDGYGKVFFPVHLKDIHPLVYPLLEVIARRQSGNSTPEDDAFFRKHFADLPKERQEELKAHLNYFGMYAHGTHVAGIVRAMSPEARILSARVFPDEPPPLYPATGLVDWAYRFLALLTNGTFHQVSAYHKDAKVDVANYSLGIALPAIARVSLVLRGNKNPSEEEIAQEVRRIFAEFEPEGRKWMEASPGTLFVIASGNEGADNDRQPAFPANVRAGNALSVAASQGNVRLAAFSNFGGKTVDVAAPGVAVRSAVPSTDGTARLPLSGTSMAAPYVAGVAARVKDANPALSPEEIRSLLMQTVDFKDWLKGKVVSGGLVNPERALKAAQLSRNRDLTSAIQEARGAVADQEEDALPRQTQASPLLDGLAREMVF